ncbi:MAG: hypothetical protein EXS16_09460 [Gemmataceae bacterium]|nr:hypothetical protein [Gemmataceae bacterium]
MRSRWIYCCIAVLICSTQAPAQETLAKSKIISVGLFKNGLVVVKREVQINGAGVYRLDAMPEPVHGSFWIESNAKVDVAVKMREVESPLLIEGGMKMQSDLAGKTVTLHFRNDKIGSITGKFVKLAPPILPEGLAISERAGHAEHFWILQTTKGRLYVNPGDVAMVQAESADDKVVQRKAVLLLNVDKSAKKPSVYVSYLSHGLAWAPSYHVDISNPKSLSIEMAAIVRNEFADLADAEIRFISGFPSVEFANVSSPLTARTNWAKFFQEVSSRDQGEHTDANLRQNLKTTNNAFTIYDAFVPPRLNINATPVGEGVDLHYEPLGKHTLLRDESMSLSIGKAKADFERIVQWTVGSSPVAKRLGGSRAQQTDEMWDVLVFKNPFKFPMTTAPAMVVENGRFNGQRTANWTNVGEEANLRITRSLSIRTMSREQEDGKPNEHVVVDDKNYSKVYLKGELVMSNHRAQPVKLQIRHAIRGTISEIEGMPKLVTREESLEDINRIHEALWTVTLNPGEERRLNYKYSVLVYR